MLQNNTCIQICTYILYLGIKLGLKHITICSAAVYFHKFYKHVDENSYDNYVSIYILLDIQQAFKFKLITIHSNYNLVLVTDLIIY